MVKEVIEWRGGCDEEDDILMVYIVGRRWKGDKSRTCYGSRKVVGNADVSVFISAQAGALSSARSAMEIIAFVWRIN